MIVSCEKLTKKFDEFVAVREVTFQIPAGICFGLLGPNGAGKSTLIKMLYGANTRSSGSLKVLGFDPASDSRAIKKKMGVVTQDNYLDEALTVEENMSTYATFLGVAKDYRSDRINELLKFMKLEHKSRAPIKDLSGGMKRRLVFVRALLGDPELIVLDEPTTGLDPAVRHLLWDKINDLRSDGKTIILTTHYMDEAEQLCDDLVIMEAGQIQAQDSPKKMIGDYCPGYLAIVENPRAENLIGPDIWVKKRLGGYQVRALSLESLHDFLLKNDLQPKIIRPTQMEDVFLEITGQELSQDA